MVLAVSIFAQLVLAAAVVFAAFGFSKPTRKISVVVIAVLAFWALNSLYVRNLMNDDISGNTSDVGDIIFVNIFALLLGATTVFLSVCAVWLVWIGMKKQLDFMRK